MLRSTDVPKLKFIVTDIENM